MIRYFLMFIPLLVAALIAQGRQTRWGTAAAVLAAGVSLVADFAVTFQGPGGVRQGAYRAPGFAKRVSEEVIASLAETLPAEFPDGARIGIVSEYNDVVFHLFRSVPRISFVPVREIDVPDLLRSGRIDGAVIGQFRNEAGQGWTLPGIPVPRNMLVVPDPSRFFRAHPSQYGFEMGLREGRTAARIPLGREKRWESGTFHLRLPAELASALGGPLELVLPADRDLSVADTIEAHCHGVRAGVGVQGRALRVKIPTACANVDRVLMDLVLARGPQAWPISFRGDAWVLGGPAGGGEVRGQTSGAQDGASASSPALIRRRIRGSFEEDFMNRRTSRIVAAGALAFGFVAARPLAARELAGVNLPDTMSAGESTLRLNGLGLRKKAIFKVYVGGLYLAAPSKDAAAIVAADAPKAVRMHFLRDLKKTQLTEGFSEGFEANAKEKAASQKASIDKMLALVPDVKEGETMSFVYVPGKGTTLYAGDKALGTFEGKVFADAVFSIWLGPKPPSEDLKKGMLG